MVQEVEDYGLKVMCLGVNLNIGVAMVNSDCWFGRI